LRISIYAFEQSITMSKEISKLFSYVLRHAPERIGIVLDENGWTPVDDLIEKANAAGFAFDRPLLNKIVAENDKQRFTLSGDGNYIRAAQGHTVDVDLGLQPSLPPAVLFHGTASSNLDSIFAEGLKPRERRHVHLSLDEATATKVGQRHGKPVVLHVDAARMTSDGIVFWRAENGVWLTNTVLPIYLKIHDKR
jgi:putative RNA 2'-phosphotransferase